MRALVVGFVGGAVVAVVSVAHAEGASVAAQIKQLGEKALATVAGGQVRVALRTTPPFPIAWPPTGQTVIYAYAASFDPQLHDAERTTPPFARIRVEKRTATLEETDKALGKTEPQGFFPIGKDHPLIAKRELAESAILDAAATPTDRADAIRSFYCAWTKANGVVSKPIRARHPAFFAWLACN